MPKTNVAPATEYELSLIRKVQRATFPVGSAHKRFIHTLGSKSKLSDKGRKYLAFIAYRYRRQYKLSFEDYDYIGKWNYENTIGRNLKKKIKTALGPATPISHIFVVGKE